MKYNLFSNSAGNITVLLLCFILFITCTYEEAGITKEMKIGLISFEQEAIGYSYFDKSSYEKVIEKKDNGFLTFTVITEETGCPMFEGGYKIIDKTLILYYQDVNFRLVKCIDQFRLKYVIKDENIDYEKIRVERLKPIKKGFSLK